MHELPLFERLPAIAALGPRVPLGRFPTPIEAHQLDTGGRRIALLVKRDDLCGERYGGNKVRKLEFLLGAARGRGAGRLITVGATGSHHALATAIYGAAHGFAVSLVLFPQQLTQHVREVLLMMHAFGAELRFTPAMERVPFAVLHARVARRRERPYLIPPGGSNAVGTLGYVNAALELAAQIERGEASLPDRIYVAAGTLGTAAGLALGFACAGLAPRIVAVRITSKLVTNARVLRRLIAATRSTIVRAGGAAPPVRVVERLVTLRHDQLGGGYGRSTSAGDEAVLRFAELGLTLDATYTAKAAAALLADAAAGTQGENPLFWQTLSAAEPQDVLTTTSAKDLPPPFAAYLEGA